MFRLKLSDEDFENEHRQITRLRANQQTSTAAR